MPTPSASWTAARWHQLFCACQQQLVAYLAGKTGSRDEAQELAQETWLRLADAPPQLPDGSSPTLEAARDRKSTRLNSSHANISYAVFCLKKKNTTSATVSNNVV